MKQRKSGIELLKIIAMILIVLSHVTMTLHSENLYFPSDYVMSISHATTNIQKLLLCWFHTLGAQGNIIFFVCSAWFLIDSRNINTRKIMRILVEVWIINMAMLVFFMLGGWFEISIKEVITILFPTTFALNWYITCYILFYLIHVAINEIINNRTQTQLLTINIIALTLYCGINYLHEGHFFSSALIVFVVIYFAVAYIKKYMPNYCKSVKLNIITLTIGILGIPILILVTNFLGLHISWFQDKISIWGGNHSPFILITAISLMNLFAKIKFVSNSINYLSSLTLLIYIIHENYLIRTYIRPVIWINIYKRYGYDFVVLWDLLQVIIIFIFTVIIAFFYQKVFQKFVYRFSDRLHSIIVKRYANIACTIMKKH